MKQTKLTFFINFLVFQFMFLNISFLTCAQQSSPFTGSEQPDLYMDLLKGKTVGIVANQTSVMTHSQNKHVVDFLLENGINVKTVFVPEHGFRGKADAGEKVDNTVDAKTGLPIISLYGANKKPSPEQLQNLDIIIFDLQDVGARFYTYISTMHYVMEATAEQGKKMIVFDRPNPNGDYIAGPILKKGYESFVGMHPIPIVHGLTIGELAQMINGEKWLKKGVTTDLEIVPVKNWTHNMSYKLPVKPSPNLPNDLCVRLYPSTCFFEGTIVSLGRGTQFPFQVYGYPDSDFGKFSFTPVSIEGMSKKPPHENKKCYGKDLRNEPEDRQFTLKYLLDAYQKSKIKGKGFFSNYFNTLAGTDELQAMIIAGKTEKEILANWSSDLEKYRKLRSQYLLY
jgi:uncharacterized protein YbbC (DUF1343 family)